MTDKKETKEIVHAIPQALLHDVVANYKKPAALIGENGLPKQLHKAVIEAAPNAEMGQHPGHDRHALAGNATIITLTGASLTFPVRLAPVVSESTRVLRLIFS